MVECLFDKSLDKRYDSLAKKQAALDERKRKLVGQTMEKIDAKTINEVIEVVMMFGHPYEKDKAEQIKGKYDSNYLEFDDLMTLRDLYKSNYQNFSNKGQ